MNFTYTLGRKNTFGTISGGSVGNNVFTVFTNLGKRKVWGVNNLVGQFGNNTTIGNFTPKTVLKAFRKIDAQGSQHCLGIDSTGQVWAWGYSAVGALGDGSTQSRLTPVQIAGTKKTFCVIATGGKGGFANPNSTSFAIDKNGKLWGWGAANEGRLGNNATVIYSTPVSVCGTAKTFCKINASQWHSCAIDKNGKVWSWGFGSEGRLGNNATINYCTPVSVCGAAKTFCEISVSQFSSHVLDKNGRAWGWGNNVYGTLGDNSTNSQLTPVSVVGAIKTFCKIAAGATHVLAIDKNGKIWGWGYNASGQLGNNTIIAKLTPVSVCGTASTKTFCDISVGGFVPNSGDFEYRLGQSLAIDNRGGVWVWGYNTRVNKNSYSPTYVIGAIKTFCGIATGYGTTIAIEKNGRAWSWGSQESSGLLGNNAVGDVQESPVSVCGAIKTFCHIYVSNAHAMAIDKNGRAWGWGRDFYGAIGNGGLTYNTPVSVLGAVKTFCKISVGIYSTSAIDKNGRAWAWGWNNYGQIGNNAVISQITPVSVCGTVKTFCEIISSGYNTLGLDKNGMIWGWGQGGSWLIGNNSGLDRYTPVSVCGTTKTFCKIYLGNANGARAAAIDKNGKAWVWGSAAFLGNNSGFSTTPVSVCGASKTFCRISLGPGHTLAIDNRGKIWAWGINDYGQVFNATDIKSFPSGVGTPVGLNIQNKTFCSVSAGEQYSIAIDKDGRAWGWGKINKNQTGTEFYDKTPVKII